MPRLRQPKEKPEEEQVLTPPDQEEQVLLSAEETEETLEQEESPDGAAEALKAQLDELRKSEETQRLRADQAVREREEAIRRSREREEQISRFQKEAVDSQFDAVSSAIAAATAEAEKAQQDIENAIAIGDSKAQADAYRRLARAESNLSRLEDGKVELEAKRKEPPTTVVASPAIEDPLEKSGLPDNAKNWLRTHPEYLQDARKNSKIQALHWDVIDEGHAAFSPSYFQSLEEHLGIRQASSGESRQQQPQQRTSIVSAPVSREVPNGGGTRSSAQIKLTPAQREAAKMAGVTEKVYAEQLQKLNEMRANGSYGDRQ